MAHSRPLALRRWLPATALFATAIVHSPAPAWACSYAIQTIEVSYPMPDAVDVPTNAVLFVYGDNLKAQTTHLYDASAEAGSRAEVPVLVEPAEPSGFDVRPLEPLEPGHHYELVSTSEQESLFDSVRFTTGSGPAPVPDHMETPELNVTVLLYPLGLCGEQQGVCLDTSAPPGTTLEVRIGTQMLRAPLAYDPSRWLGAYGTYFPESACLEARVRDVRGRRSAPRTVCGADALRVRAPSDSQGDNTCENYSSDPDPGFAASSDTAVTTSSAPADDVPAPREVTYVASGASDPSAASGCGCQLTSKETRSTAGLLSIGWMALLSLRRRRGQVPMPDSSASSQS